MKTKILWNDTQRIPAMISQKEDVTMDEVRVIETIPESPIYGYDSNTLSYTCADCQAKNEFPKKDRQGHVTRHDICGRCDRVIVLDPHTGEWIRQPRPVRT